VIVGRVAEDGVPIISLEIAGRTFQAIIDTGFNGDLELPVELQDKLNCQHIGRLRSALAGGQIVEEDAFAIDFPFDGELIRAIATFVSSDQILVGTNLLRDHRLQIGFASGYVRLERE
jgi:predicted aspartyl protease